jgi:S1-C subfamily serine protease
MPGSRPADPPPAQLPVQGLAVQIFGPHPARRGRASGLLLGLLGLLAIAALFASRESGPLRMAAPDPVLLDVAETPAFEAEERRFTALFEARRGSVVHIDAAREDTGRGFFLGSDNRQRTGLGSGLVWDRAGHVLTNLHLLAGSSAAIVRLSDGSEWRARLVGTAPGHDLAVLAIDAPPERLEPLPLGDSAGLRVGQRAAAIGNPFGLDWTLTSGIVSGLGRVVETEWGLVLDGLIQTDAAIHPGNSGGPLLDGQGRLIGLNTALAREPGGTAAFGFAVPVDSLARLVPQILSRGSLPRAGIGVRLLEDRSARELGLEGAVVAAVLDGSPAARAGLQPARISDAGDLVPGDCILAVDSQPVRETRDLASILARRSVGERVRVAVAREGRTREVELELGDVMPLDPGER